MENAVFQRLAEVGGGTLNSVANNLLPDVRFKANLRPNLQFLLGFFTLLFSVLAGLAL